MSFCPACRRELADVGRYCGFCGFDLTPMDPIPLTRRKGEVDPIPLVARKKRPNEALEASGQGGEERGGREQRQDKRHPLRVDVTYFSEHNFYTGFAENISSGGIFIATYEPLPLGEELDVLFTVPGIQEPSRARGRIVWVREHDPLNADSVPGIGLRFDDLDSFVADAVNLFIRHRDPIFFEE